MQIPVEVTLFHNYFGSIFDLSGPSAKPGRIDFCGRLYFLENSSAHSDTQIGSTADSSCLVDERQYGLMEYWHVQR